MKAAVVAIAIVGLSLTSCSSNSDNGKGSTASPVSSSTAPSGPKSYSTVASLKDDAVAAGLPCPVWDQDDVVVAAAESGTCGEDTVLSTYATDADLQMAIGNLRDMNDLMKENKLEPVPVLIGPNWIINAPNAASLTGALGGTIDR